MTLFPPTPSDTDEQHAATPAERARAERARIRSRRGWLALGISFLVVLVLALWPTSYVIQQPGPVFNTLGSVEVKDKTVPMITVDGAETFETDGALDMLTVQAVGNPEQRPNWFEISLAWFNPSKTVVPLEAIFPVGETTEERDAENAALMVDSQQDAVAAALSTLGYDFPAQLTVGQVAEGTPADSQLKVDDELVSVNGEAVSDLPSLRAAIAANGTEAAAVFGIVRGGVPMNISITPTPATAADGTETGIIGVATKMVYDFPIDVTIQLDNVGGPSAGMMFALGIIDKLTEGELNGGQHVAGTGTIDASGTVGAIGGIRQKLFGARDAGARYFLAPESNCTEVVGHVPDGIRVFSVGTLEQAVTALDAIADESGLDALPTCE
ncbi:PDZ domain-containing protein [Okibacterium sp. HSC-33S16]|uniref:YlbL family protein n=1 Tax=Okibacterium sp. HSC-33S16 TaxID=2910965 RepID=UPI00209ED00A|nr:S16 family serine protease [Okibacterium sp. HSC-33S16]MCP2030432.1 PDZ domain-containing protein [Okibacterium sp. HSC-33S16]